MPTIDVLALQEDERLGNRSQLVCRIRTQPGEHNTAQTKATLRGACTIAANLEQQWKTQQPTRKKPPK